MPLLPTGCGLEMPIACVLTLSSMTYCLFSHVYLHDATPRDEEWRLGGFLVDMPSCKQTKNKNEHLIDYEESLQHVSDNHLPILVV